MLTDVATIGNSASYSKSTVTSLINDMRKNATTGVKRVHAPKASVDQLTSMGIKVEVG